MRRIILPLLLLNIAAAILNIESSHPLLVRNLDDRPLQTDWTILLHKKDLHESEQRLQRRGGGKKRGSSSSGGKAPPLKDLPKARMRGASSPNLGSHQGGLAGPPKQETQQQERARSNPNLNVFMALQNSDGGSSTQSFKTGSTKSWAKSSEQSFKSASSTSFAQRPFKKLDIPEGPSRAERRKSSIAHGVGKNKAVSMANDVGRNLGSPTSGSLSSSRPQSQKSKLLQKQKSLDSSTVATSGSHLHLQPSSAKQDSRFPGRWAQSSSSGRGSTIANAVPPSQPAWSGGEAKLASTSHNSKATTASSGLSTADFPPLTTRPLSAPKDPKKTRLAPQRPGTSSSGEQQASGAQSQDSRLSSATTSQGEARASSQRPSVQSPVLPNGPRRDGATSQRMDRPGGASSSNSAQFQRGGVRPQGPPPRRIPRVDLPPPSSSGLSNSLSTSMSSRSNPRTSPTEQSDTATSQARVGRPTAPEANNVRPRVSYVIPQRRPPEEGTPEFNALFPPGPARAQNPVPLVRPPAQPQPPPPPPRQPRPSQPEAQAQAQAQGLPPQTGQGGPSNKDPPVPAPSPDHGKKVGPIGSPKYYGVDIPR